MHKALVNPEEGERTRGEQAAYLMAFWAAALILVTIKSEVLLGLALAVLAICRIPLRLPPLKLPIALYWLGTLVSLTLSPDSRAGLPQVYKLLVWGTLLTVSTTFRSVRDARWLTTAWAALAVLSAGWSFVQYGRKMAAAQGGYAGYVISRTTGFMGHWMTFGGETMIVLAMLTALLLYAPPASARWRAAGWAAACVIAWAIVLNGSRNIWFGAAAACAYLLWRKRKALLLAVPAAALVVLLAGPGFVRERAVSLYRPHGELDSNRHRAVSFRTGLRMIEAHPWFGVGPEQVGPRFRDYVRPEDLPLPDGFYGHLHNIYLQFAAERGLPVLGCVLWLLGKILFDLGRAARRVTGEARFAVEGALAVVLSVMVAGLAEHNLGDSEILTLFLAVVGLGYIAAGLTARNLAGAAEG
jgi:putative inorganic carbon (hco3(-)) transporter